MLLLMYSFLFLGCQSSLHDLHVFEYHHIKQLVHCINFNFLSIYRMPSAAFDVELESFITTLYTCEAAVYLDTSPSRKDTLKHIWFLCWYPSPLFVKCSDLWTQNSWKHMGNPSRKFAKNYWRTCNSK